MATLVHTSCHTPTTGDHRALMPLCEHCLRDSSPQPDRSQRTLARAHRFRLPEESSWEIDSIVGCVTQRRVLARTHEWDIRRRERSRGPWHHDFDRNSLPDRQTHHPDRLPAPKPPEEMIHCAANSRRASGKPNSPPVAPTLRWQATSTLPLIPRPAARSSACCLWPQPSSPPPPVQQLRC